MFAQQPYATHPFQVQRNMATVFPHPPPLPLNGYQNDATATASSAPASQSTQATPATYRPTQPYTSEVSPAVTAASAAPTSIGHQYASPAPQQREFVHVDYQQQQQQQEQQQSAPYVQYQSQQQPQPELNAQQPVQDYPPTQPPVPQPTRQLSGDYIFQRQQSEYAHPSHSSEFPPQAAPQQQQQQQSDYEASPHYLHQSLEAEYSMAGEYSAVPGGSEAQYHQMDSSSDSPYIGTMGLLQSFKRPRGEKISSKDFVPPDVTGLSKREARLVKNRAAAFLSRQRKREEFEAMELRVADLEAQNASLLAQLSAGIPAGADGALVRALQARIGVLESELRGRQAMQHLGVPVDASRSPSPDKAALVHGRTGSFDSVDLSLNGNNIRSAHEGGMTDGQKEAVIGMGLMALLSLTSMSPPTTKFVFAPADAADEPPPVTATPFNYDSIARWQERLAQANGSPSEATMHESGVKQEDTGAGLGSTRAEFDIAFSTTEDGRIRCHVSVPRTQLDVIAAAQAQTAPQQALRQRARQHRLSNASLHPGSHTSSYPATPHIGYNSASASASTSASGSQFSGSPAAGLGLGLGASPEQGGVASHPGSASSYHTTFESAGYTGVGLGLPGAQLSSVGMVDALGQSIIPLSEEAWIAQHQQWQQQQLVQPQLQVPLQAEWGSNSITPIAPRPTQGPLAGGAAGSASVPSPQPETASAAGTGRQLGPSRRVKVALRSQTGKGEWEVEVC